MLCFKKIDAFLINSSLNSALLKHQYPRALMIERMCRAWLVISKKKSREAINMIVMMMMKKMIMIINGHDKDGHDNKDGFDDKDDKYGHDNDEEVKCDDDQDEKTVHKDHSYI